RAPVPMDLRIERRAGRQRVGGKEMLARLEEARAAVLQPDLHLARQDEHPLRLRRAVPLAAEADRAMAQLVAAGREYAREQRLRRSLREGDRFLAPAGPAVAV